MLARAFHDDPVWAWALALEERRVHVVALGGDGVALWVAPHTRRVTQLELWRARLPLLPVRLGRESGARIQAFQAASRALLARLDHHEAWFLSGLGVDPPAQRRGIGTALVEWGLERARRDARPAVLLTSTAANLPFYERLGFRVAAQEELPRGGPVTWAMRREA